MDFKPRYFKIIFDSDDNFNLIIASPSPKFKGLIQVSVFYKKSSIDNSGDIYLPEFDITLQFNRPKNIKYPNSPYCNLGLMVETTESTFDSWFSKYLNVLGCESSIIQELTEYEAFHLPITVFTDHINYQYDEPLEPDIDQAVDVLSDKELFKTKYL